MSANLLARHAGAWSGTNGFRMMPNDPLDVRPATAIVGLAAGGNLTSFSYTWEHATDGPQEGVILVWQDADEGAHAIFADSWHQKPEPMPMTGAADDATIELEGEYGGGWKWRIVIESPNDATLRMTMLNVVPAEFGTEEFAGGPYPVSITELTRA